MITIVLLILFAVLQVLDVLLTNRVLSDGGKEVNPVMRWIMDHLGHYWWLSKLPIFLGLVFLTFITKQSHIIIGLLDALYVGVVWWNYRQAQK